MKQTYRVNIVKTTQHNDDVFTISVQRPQDMPDVKPSQFFNLTCDNMPYLRRPISISRIADDTLDFTIIVKGQGTLQMQTLQAGDTIDLLGPLGNCYQIDGKYQNVLVIGGGIGVPPQAVLVEALAKENCNIKVQLGFRDNPYLLERFRAVTDDVTVASEAGLADYQGYVTDLTESVIGNQPIDMVYVCGPHIVIKKVAAICQKHAVPVQLLMEARMACGVGACMVCACKVKDNSMPGGYWYKRVCSDGPVFWGEEVCFDEDN